MLDSQTQATIQTTDAAAELEKVSADCVEAEQRAFQAEMKVAELKQMLGDQEAEAGKQVPRHCLSLRLRRLSAKD